MSSVELQLIGLPGPTHQFSGLGSGNLASREHRGQVSHPRQAALQVLDLMKLVHGLGVPVAVLPPHPRPDLAALRRVGFSGSDEAVLHRALHEAPALLAAASSSSAMWAANAATVSPAMDCRDGRVHFTPANLASQFHRSLEAPRTAAVLRTIFADDNRFAHHQPLPACTDFRDEGAANHLRIAPDPSEPGFEVFVHGGRTGRFPARQSRGAGEAIARLHGLDGARTLFLEQHPAAIDAGVFHNDVISTANGAVLLAHELAFADSEAFVTLARLCPEMRLVRITADHLALSDAVTSYLFNSLVLTLPDGRMALVAPAQCRESDSARACIASLLADPAHPIKEVHYPEVDESMMNGGGPACLRLRVVLEPDALAVVHPGVLYTASLAASLRRRVVASYPETLRLTDLGDPLLVRHARETVASIHGDLGLELRGEMSDCFPAGFRLG